MYLGPRLCKGLSLKRSSVAATPPRLTVFLFSFPPIPSHLCPVLSPLFSSYSFLRCLCYNGTEWGMLSLASCDFWTARSSFSCIRSFLGNLCVLNLGQVSGSEHISRRERKIDKRCRGGDKDSAEQENDE